MRSPDRGKQLLSLICRGKIPITDWQQLYLSVFQLLGRIARWAFRGANATLGAEKNRMTRYPITTGLQTVTAAGPVTGTLGTAALNVATLFLDVTGLTSGSCRISIEDSATGAFGDALPVKVWHFVAGENNEGITVSANLDEIPNIRAGATGNALRVNVLSLGSGAILNLAATAAA
jgi:hypothetical protein